MPKKMQVNLCPSLYQHQFLVVRDLGEGFDIMCARILFPFPLPQSEGLFKRTLTVYIIFLKRTMTGMCHHSQKELLNNGQAEEA